MSLRISSALAALAVLGGCDAVTAPLAPPGERVACAIGEGAALAQDCTLERAADGKAIVIHHPDGGFRRLTRDPATGDLAPGDGAEVLVRQPGEGDALAFAIGADRYAIPRALLDPPAQQTPTR